MAVDLHTHSDKSDGSDSPAQLVEKASAKGLSAVALTDHDTQEGIAEAAEAAARTGIELVPGVEISCAWPEGAMHLAVLFLEPGPGPLQDALERVRSSRNTRNIQIAERLRRLGIDISIEEVLAEARVGVTGRPHFAAVLVRKGVVPDIPAAFDEFLGDQAPAYVDRERLGPEEAITLARASGAIPVLSHPHTLRLDTADDYAGAYMRLASAGLIGIEAYYGDYPPEQRDELAATARSFGLIPSGGSDYHGTYKEGLELGTGWGDLHVPDTVLEELRAAL